MTASADPQQTDRLPVGYRFTLPGFGHCEITGHAVQTPEQFIQDIRPQFDYVVRCGPHRVKKLMTHEIITDACGVQEGWV